jgi:RNA polymerase sigma factor (sigma-70 family)
MTNYMTRHVSITGLKETDQILAAQKGDLEAFNQLVLAYQDRIFGLTLGILGDEAPAEDITQKTFLTAYLNLPRFRNGSFRSWLYRTAINACIDEIRRNKTHPVVHIGSEGDDEEGSLPLYDIPDTSMLPEQEAEKRELEQVIQHAIHQLDPDQRAVVVLVDLQDCDYEEASHILGIPLGTVKSRLARARLQLRQLLRNAADI